MNSTLLGQWTAYLPWMVAGQLVLVLLVTNILIYIYNRQLKQRNQDLAKKLRQLLTQQKQIKLNTAIIQPPPANQRNDIEIVNGELNQLLNQALSQTQSRLIDLGLNTIDLDPLMTKDQMAAALRYHFLESEKQALEFFNDPAQLWQTLQSNLDKIYQSLKLGTSEQIPTLAVEQPQANNDSTNQDLLSPEALEDAFTAMGVAEGSGAEKAAPPQARIKRHVKGLTHLIDQQRQSIEELDRIRMIHREPHQQEFIQEYQQQIRQMERLLNESESCIKTLESEVDQAQQKIAQLESKL